MSDSYFIGTVSRVHNLWRFGRPPADTTSSSSQTPLQNLDAVEKELKPDPRSWHTTRLASLEAAENNASPNKKEARKMGMMVSLDHTIYFHRPREVKADEWLCSEMESPWTGEGRGLVLQRIWNREGRLLATCVQEVCGCLSPLCCAKKHCSRSAKMFPQQHCSHLKIGPRQIRAGPETQRKQAVGIRGSGFPPSSSAFHIPVVGCSSSHSLFHITSC